MGKQRNRTDWQVDLKPVALASTHGRTASSNGNGAHAAAPATGTNPALTKALGELQAADAQTLKALAEIHAAVNEIHTSIAALATRVEAIEARLASPAAEAATTPPVRTAPRAPRAPRTPREPSTLARRTRQAALPPADDGTQP